LSTATCAAAAKPNSSRSRARPLADGGYAVPREIDAMIAASLKEISPIRAIAQVVQVGTRATASW
jgi:HK97 family phage major capsid protein